MATGLTGRARAGGAASPGSRTSRARRSHLTALAVALAAVVAACSGPAATPHRAQTTDYLPGRAADVYLPTGVTEAPVVVLVPGGAWRTADRSGLAPLAEALADAGAVAVTATHLAVDDGGRFPGPVQDVTCSVAFAAQAARRAKVAPTHVVVLGHSSGGHLAALAALAPDHFGGSCPYPPVRPDGLIGLAGAYDVHRFADLAEPLFGADARHRPDLWRDGDVLTWARSGTGRGLHVLLLHGEDDDVVPVGSTRTFAKTLQDNAFDVDVQVVPDATHATVYTDDVAAPRVLAWLEDLDTL